jgi:hypothetical protein
MATERTAPQMASFFKFTREGQKVVGQIAKYGNNNNGGFITLRPVLLRDNAGEKLRAYEAAAIGLSTDLQHKIRPTDVGQSVSIEWTDSEPTAKSPRKIFTVNILDRTEIRDYAAQADMTKRNEPYPGRDVDNAVVGDEEDDLPF